MASDIDKVLNGILGRLSLWRDAGLKRELRCILECNSTLATERDALAKEVEHLKKDLGAAANIMSQVLITEDVSEDAIIAIHAMLERVSERC